MRASEGKLQADRFLLLIRESLASRTWATSRRWGVGGVLRHWRASDVGWRIDKRDVGFQTEGKWLYEMIFNVLLTLRVLDFRETQGEHKREVIHCFCFIHTLASEMVWPAEEKSGRSGFRIHGDWYTVKWVLSERTVSFMLHKGSDLVRSRKGGLSSFSIRKTYRINFPSSEEIVLSPWVCFWSPHLVPLVHSRSGTWLFPCSAFSIAPGCSRSKVPKSPRSSSDPSEYLPPVNTCPHCCPLTLGSSLSQD